MKKLTVLASMLALFAACSKDAPIDEGGHPIVSGDRLVLIGSASDDVSRTQFSDGEKGFMLNWVAGEDRIGLYMRTGETRLDNLAYAADRSEATTTFTAVGERADWADETSGHDFYAYYPYDPTAADPTAVPLSVPAVQTQQRAGDTEHLAALDFLYASNEGLQKTEDGRVVLQFRHPLSVLEFGISSEIDVADVSTVILRCTDEEEILSAEGAAIDLTTGAVDYSAAEASHQIALELAEPESFSAGEPAKRFFAQITPGHGGKQLQVIALSHGQEILLGTKFVPASGIPAGRKATINFGVSAKVRLSDNGTANSYIVSQPATQYLFNATVKGNGKAARYEWTDGSGNARSVTVSAADIAVKPRSAKLLWTTESATAPVIENVAYDAATGMISFETPAAFIDGNAVIAAYASDDCTGDVLWSWHIWTLRDYDADSKAFRVGDSSTIIMDRNLGAIRSGRIDDGGQASLTVGMTYQWGRKDPFPGLGGGNSNLTWADGGLGGQGTVTFSPDGSIAHTTRCGSDVQGVANKVYHYGVASNGMQQVDATAYTNDVEGAIAQSVKEPWRYHTIPSNAKIPFVGQTDSPDDYAWLWGNPTGDPEGGEKSIYDPCPVGWKIAPTSVYTTLTSLGRTNGTLGAYLGGIYFYFRGGLREASSGYYASSVDKEGNLWTDSRATRFQLTASGANPTESDANPSWGIPVRCVSDRPVDLLANAEDLSAAGTANAYVVNKAGTLYKFKATVKGNGYNPLSTGTTELAPAKARILWTLQQIRAKDSSWPQTDGSDPTLSNTILYNSVTLKDGYIYFRTNENMENANVFIAATDDAGEVLWSWHLWCVNGYDPDATAQTVTAKGINSTMLDRNLGAFGNPAVIAQPTYQDYVSARGLFYQWGRKDPFPFFRSMAGYNPYVTWTDAAGNISTSITWTNGTWNTNFSKSNTALGFETLDETLDYIAANPMVFISVGLDGSPNNWTQGASAPAAGTEAEWGKLWGNQKNDARSPKSMYDPCPAGYQIPTTDQLRFVTAHNENISPTWLKAAPWKANCRETIYDAAGNNVSAYDQTGNPFYNEPYGLHFYIHGTRSELQEGDEGYDPEAANVGKAPEDETVSYFPSQGWACFTGVVIGVNDFYNKYGQILIQANAPSGSASQGGHSYHLRATHDGYFYYNSDDGSWADRVGTGIPVRCVKE